MTPRRATSQVTQPTPPSLNHNDVELPASLKETSHPLKQLLDKKCVHTSHSNRPKKEEEENKQPHSQIRNNATPERKMTKNMKSPNRTVYPRFSKRRFPLNSLSSLPLLHKRQSGPSQLSVSYFLTPPITNQVLLFFSGRG